MADKNMILRAKARQEWIEKSMREHPEIDFNEFALQVCAQCSCCLRTAREEIRIIKWRIDNEKQNN